MENEDMYFEAEEFKSLFRNNGEVDNDLYFSNDEEEEILKGITAYLKKGNGIKTFPNFKGKFIKSGDFELSEITPEKSVQREIKISRASNIAASIIHYDQYLEMFPIILTQDNRILGGQHRYFAALHEGLDKVFCVQYHFETKEDEAGAYLLEGMHNTSLSLPDKVKCMKENGDLLGLVLYELNENSESFFKGKILLQKSTNTGDFNCKVATSILAFCIGGLSIYYWADEKHSTILDILKIQEDMDEIIVKMNWFYEIFQKIHGTKAQCQLKGNDDPYKINYVMAFIRFMKYVEVHKGSRETSKWRLQKFINKMKKFDLMEVERYLKKKDGGYDIRSAIIRCLKEHWNKGRDIENRLSEFENPEME